METETHYFYVLECKDGTYYAGYTNNLKLRIEKHNAGKGAKYTRGRAPLKLIFHQIYTSKSEAQKIEYRFKRLSRQKKIEWMTNQEKKVGE